MKSIQQANAEPVYSNANIVLLLGLLLAFVPFAGLLIWIVGPFLCLLAAILAVVGLSKGGGVFQGLCILIASLAVFPALYFIVPPIILSFFGE